LQTAAKPLLIGIARRDHDRDAELRWSSRFFSFCTKNIPRRGGSARCWPSGAVIFGGPQSANDEDEFIKREIDWVDVPLRDRKPFLGICLGGQMMARHLGASVYPHPQGHAEVGYYPIRPTPAGRAICADWPDAVYQWHREGFALPSGGELLAEGDAFSVQAFRYSTGYALQFHPEVTHAMMYRWLVRGAHRMELPGTKQRHEHIADRAVHDHASRNWLAVFIDHWIGRAPAIEAAE
jgi:GMP synthase (glutamine-hydrolysing)